MNKYFILRHGDTVWTKTKRCYPWPDSKKIHLTKEGHERIKEVADALEKEKIDLLFSSDIFRAKQTAEIIAKKLGLKIHFDKRLRDTFLADYQRKKILAEDFYKDFPDPRKRFEKGPAGGESWNDVIVRVKSFLEESEKKYRGKKILLVSHGDPLWFLNGVVNNLNKKQLLKEVFVEQKYIRKGELRRLN